MSNGNLKLNTPQFTLYSYSPPLPSQICFSCSVSSVCISVFLPVPQCFHYCSFILFFSIWLLFISSSCLITIMVRTPYIVQFSLVAQSCLILCNPMDCSTQGLPVSFTNSQSLLGSLMSIQSVMPAEHLILCRLLLLLPSIFPSIRVFSMSQFFTWGGQSIGASASASSHSNKYSGLISFRIDWFDLLAVQGTFRSLLQHHSSKASILRHSAFFTVQLSHPYMTTGKTTALTIQTVVGKVMSLLINMLSRFVIAFLPKSKHLLISWLQSPSAMILEPQENKDSHCFHCFPIYLPWSDGTGCCDLSFLNAEF